MKGRIYETRCEGNALEEKFLPAEDIKFAISLVEMAFKVRNNNGENLEGMQLK